MDAVTMDWVRLIVELVLGLAASGFLLGLLMLRAQKRKLLSEAGKTDAEATGLLSGADAQYISSRIMLVEPYEKIMNRLQRELNEATDRIDVLENYIEVLIASMRDQGMHIPIRPRFHQDPTPAPPSAPAS